MSDQQHEHICYISESLTDAVRAQEKILRFAQNKTDSLFHQLAKIEDLEETIKKKDIAILDLKAIIEEVNKLKRNKK